MECIKDAGVRKPFTHCSVTVFLPDDKRDILNFRDFTGISRGFKG
jgi:hypothetical protein